VQALAETSRYSPAARNKVAPAARNKKADVPLCPEAFRHVGLLINEPPGIAELPFI
jgi:hypothetical protein